jgi:zinc transport system substrate-binding protein
MAHLKTLYCTMLIICATTLAVAQDRPRLVAVNYPLQYLAEQLVGDAAEVIFPVPADVDPSFWRPSISDISAIQSADLVLLNGAGFAAWVDRVSLSRSKLVNTSASIENQFIVTQSITHSHGEGAEHSHEGLASYTWLDPLLAIAQAEAVAAAITSRGIAPAEEVENRLAAMRSDLNALDATAAEALADLAGVKMIATHPRYQYFARRYGLSIAALEWEAGAIPTDAEIADLQTLVDNSGARVLIWEAEPPEAAFKITSELGLQNVVFPTLAHRFENHTFPEAFADAIAAMAKI